MTLTDRRKELIDKIMKLLAKAESTLFPQEADSARKMAADLMVKYDIEIDTSADENVDPFLEEDFGEDSLYNRMLVSYIAKMNSVFMYILNANEGKSLKVVGKGSDMEAFHYMLAIAKSQRERALIKFYQAGNKPTDKNTKEFYVGFSIGLRAQIKAILEARTTIIQEQGLILYDKILAAKKHMEEQIGAFSKARSKKIGAFAAEGYNAGKSASLNKGISTTTTANGTLMLA